MPLGGGPGGKASWRGPGLRPGWVGHFADALHLAVADGCDGFVTFDAALVNTARRIGIAGVAAP